MSPTFSLLLFRLIWLWLLNVPTQNLLTLHYELSRFNWNFEILESKISSLAQFWSKTIIGTEGALRIPTTSDNYPSIPSIPYIHPQIALKMTERQKVKKTKYRKIKIRKDKKWKDRKMKRQKSLKDSIAYQPILMIDQFLSTTFPYNWGLWKNVIKIFWSIELSDLWSKKIYRPKMIVRSGAIFILE